MKNELKMIACAEQGGIRNIPDSEIKMLFDRTRIMCCTAAAAWKGKARIQGAPARHLGAFHNAPGVKLQSDTVLKQVQND